MDSTPQDESNVISFSLFGYVRHKNFLEIAGPGDKWFSLKKFENYPDLNYAYPTVNNIMSYAQELLNMFVTFAVLISGLSLAKSAKLH